MMRKQYLKGLLFAAMLFSFAMPATAHTGIGATHDFLSGIAHPLQGLDHIIVMVAIGLWGCILAKRLVWQLPASFLLAMLVGAAINLQGLTLSFAEQWVTLSVIVFGLIAIFTPRTSSVLAIVIVSFFAICHGYVHAAEIEVGANPISYIAGFLISTAELHGLGIGLGFLYLYIFGKNKQILVNPKKAI